MYEINNLTFRYMLSDRNSLKQISLKIKKGKITLIAGISGSGKTTGALLIAKGIGGKIAVIDTERGSASLYADLCDFDVVELGPPYTPENYINIIHEAERAGYTTLVVDSITHEWNGQGGILEIVEFDEVRNRVLVEYKEDRERQVKSVWHRSEHDAGAYGSDMLRTILGASAFTLAIPVGAMIPNSPIWARNALIAWVR